jgi:predicted O-methyltransferase YrrM
MTQEQWTAVDDYFKGLLIPADPVLEAALQAANDAGFPAAQVAPNQGKLLHILAKSIGAKRILEIGTLGAYSTIWLARALAPGGRLITLEADPSHAQVARANLERAGLAQTVEVRVGLALDSLPQLQAEGAGPFDFVFIDADKLNNTAYFDWALKLTHPGSLIVVDNVVRNGAVIEEGTTDPSTQGVRRLMSALAAEPRVLVTALQTVGSKGYDGFVIALVL